jgi:hypothetical protein
MKKPEVPDAIIVLNAKGLTFEMQAAFNGPLNMRNPAHSMAHWIAENWEGLIASHNAAKVRAANDAIATVAEIKKPSTLKLVNAQGTGLIQH